jgi:hypothetical protein
MRSHRLRRPVYRQERHLGEPGVDKPAPDGRGEVRLEPSPRPDHRRAARAKFRKKSDRLANVEFADVAEYPAKQYNVRRHGTRKRAGGRSITLDKLHPEKAGARRSLTPRLHELGRKLDQSGQHISGTRVVAQRAKEVAAITRTRADHTDGTLRPAIESLHDSVLDGSQTLGHRRVFVVASVPIQPFTRQMTER